MDICKIIFHRATSEQIGRMLEWVNDEFSPTALHDSRRLSLRTGLEYKEIFDKYDLNKDGLLSFDEFQKAYDSKLSIDILQ